MAREGLQLGIEIRIGPVGVQDRRLQVVEIEGSGRPTERAPGVLQPANEMLGILAEERFAVRLARKAQDHAQHPRATARTGGWINHPGARTEIHLGFLTRLDLHAPHSLWLSSPESAHVALDRLIRTAEADLADQILIDALRRQAGVEFGGDEFGVRVAQTGATRRNLRRVIHHGGRAGVHGSARAGGRKGGGF
jgi:hypothetical protein